MNGFPEMIEGDIEQMVNELQQQIGESLDQQGDNRFCWTLEDLLEATEGDQLGPVVNADKICFDSISTDTRTIKPGALYIAIKGENFDGHAFIDQAVKQGAAAVLTELDSVTSVPAVQVENTRAALGQFARWHRLKMPVKKLVAITGSNGKTTVKTLLQSLFSANGNTLATEGNLNNDLGVPRTLLNLRPEHEYAIIEMGANHKNEIDYLTSLALPDIAILNNAAGAHLEGFGSLQGVVEAKGEIFRGLNQIEHRPAGVAVVNTDSYGYDYWIDELERLNVENIMSFGSLEQADVRLSDFSSTENAVSFGLNINGEQHSVTMPVLGKHNAMNAAACAAVCYAAGLDWSQFGHVLSQFAGVAGRLQKNRISCGWLIDDSYNANPESVKAGIDAVTALPGDAILCLGAMAEVGETSTQAHREVAEYAKQKGVSHLFVFGSEAQKMPSVFGTNSDYFESHQDLFLGLEELLNKSCETQQMNILVKGSRSAAMENVSKPILEKFKVN